MNPIVAFLTMALFIVTPVAAREDMSLVGDNSSPFSSTTQRDYLPAKEAFRTTAWRDDDRIYIGFTVAENYYLHRHQFALESLSPGVSFGELALPPGVLMMHASLGEIYVFYDQVVVSAPIESNAADNVLLAIEMTFQGCSDQGLCYPPERVELNAQHGSTPAIFAPTSPETP